MPKCEGRSRISKGISAKPQGSIINTQKEQALLEVGGTSGILRLLGTS
jgi:hypothetical protein